MNHVYLMDMMILDYELVSFLDEFEMVEACFQEFLLTGLAQNHFYFHFMS
jgi:hypothetical protein